MNESKPPSNLLKIIVAILGTIAGILTGLIGIWVPAIYLDNLGTAAGGTGAGITLAAMFICSPVIIFLGPAIGIVGTIIAEKVCGRYDNKLPYSIFGITVAAVAGLILGVLPFILFGLYAWATGYPF